jgi:hypothetical protein
MFKCFCVLALATPILLLAPPALADDLDTAIEVVVSVGSIAGVSIDPDDAIIIKSIVKCAVSNQLVRCARQEIVNRLPQDAQGFATCILDDRPLSDCATTEALNRLPPPARAIITCITQRGDVGRCGTEVAVDAAQKQAFDVIDKLKADARSEASSALGSATSGSIRNIIGLYEGIRDNNWVQVLDSGGTEIYTAAATAVLDVVLPEFIPAGVAIRPVIHAIVQARADTVAHVIDGARRGDVAVVTEAIVEAYLIEGIVPPCAIEQIPKEIRDAVCGTLGSIIHDIAQAGGDVVKIAVGLIKDALSAIGKLAENLWDDLKNIFDAKADDCLPPEQYYATHYVRCYHRGVRQLAAGQFEGLIGSLNFRCRDKHYDRCFTSDHFDGLCNPQRDTFRNHVTRLNASVHRAAAVYVKSFQQFARDKGQDQACRPFQFKAAQIREFTELCGRAVAKHIPLAGDPDHDECDDGLAGFAAPVVHTEFCKQAMANVDVDRILDSICHPLVPARPPTNCFAPIEGVCGHVDIKCDRPLPPASFTIVRSSSIGMAVEESHGVMSEIGEITARYQGVGKTTVAVCVRNSATQPFICGESFEVTLKTSPSDLSCIPHPPVHQACSSDMKQCGTDHGRPVCIPKDHFCDPGEAHPK